MDRLEKGLDVFHNAFGLNSSNFSGAIDIIVVPQEPLKGTAVQAHQPPSQLKSTPFHVRFGKFQVFSSTEKIVQKQLVSIYVNDKLTDVKMKLGNNGEAYFLEEHQGPSGEYPESLITSPLATSPLISPHSGRVLTDSGNEENNLPVSELTTKLQELIQERDHFTAPDSVKDSTNQPPLFSKITEPLLTSPSKTSQPSSPPTPSIQHESQQKESQQKEDQQKEDQQKEDQQKENQQKENQQKENQQKENQQKENQQKENQQKENQQKENLPEEVGMNLNEGPEADLYNNASSPDSQEHSRVLNIGNPAEPEKIVLSTLEPMDYFDMANEEDNSHSFYIKTKPSSSENLSIPSVQLEQTSTQKSASAEGTPTSKEMATSSNVTTATTKEITSTNFQQNTSTDSNETNSTSLKHTTSTDSKETNSLVAKEDNKEMSLPKEVSSQQKIIFSEEEAKPSTSPRSTWVDWTWGRLPSVRKAAGPQKSLETPPEPISQAIQSDLGLNQVQAQGQQGYFSKMGSLFRIFKGRDNASSNTVPNASSTNSQVGSPAAAAAAVPISNLEVADLEEEEDEQTLFDLEIEKDEPAATAPDPSAEEIPKFEISRCGHILRPPNWDDFTYDQIHTIFDENKLAYEEICEIPDLIFDSNILFRIKGTIYPWSIAGPWMVSLIVFKKNFNKDALKILEDKYNLEKKKKDPQKRGWKEWLWRKKEALPVVPQPDKVREASIRSGQSKVNETFMIKSLRPTPVQLQKLNLRPGTNTIRFQIASRYQGIREVRARIFLWNPNTRIVISDIDGTITRSDVFGQIFPMVGRDWSHSGVAQLYSNIAKNNYQLLYLTSRAIGQADLTRGYISTLKQNTAALPEGPVIMSPNRLLSAFSQEVIKRTPEEFKIAALQDIKGLFQPDRSPFYAGFGNRPTDALAYRAVDVPFGKIFTINYQGDISVVNYTFKKTYSTLNELIEETFPVYNPNNASANYHREEWNSWQYWRLPPPSLEELK